MPIKCPLCNDDHTIDNGGEPVRCGLCNGGRRTFVRLQQFHDGEHRGWFATQALGTTWMAIDVGLGQGYRYMAAMLLPLERMTTDEGAAQVFAQIQEKCLDAIAEQLMQAQAQAQAEATVKGQATVH